MLVTAAYDAYIGSSTDPVLATLITLKCMESKGQKALMPMYAYST